MIGQSGWVRRGAGMRAGPVVGAGRGRGQGAAMEDGNEGMGLRGHRS